MNNIGYLFVRHTARTLAMLFALLLALGSTSHANQGIDWTEAQTAWLEGRAVILMRHALAPGTGDPAGHDLNDCSTQRNLSEEGRAQARDIGASLLEVLNAEPKVDVDVYSSAWCRCMETAELLGLVNPEVLPSINSFFNNFSQREPQTIATREWIENRLTNETAVPAVLVTHQVNISALTGQGATSGEFVVVTIEDNTLKVLASIRTPVP